MSDTHLHLLLNHVPAMGFLFGTGILIFALWSKEAVATKIALVLFVLSAVLMLPVKHTGEEAEHYVEEAIPTVDHHAIHEHEEAGEKAVLLSLVLGALSLFLLIKKPTAVFWSIITLVLALIVVAVISYTGYEGSKIRHTEVYTQGPHAG